MLAIETADTVTELEPRHRGAVVVTGSHGGLIAAYLAAAWGVRAAIFNDAGVGRDGAGVAGLRYLEELGMAGAAVSHLTARIADGADVLARGVVSHANAVAARCGVEPGMPCLHAAGCLAGSAPAASATPLPVSAGRFLLEQRPGVPQVWGLDSVGLTLPADDGRILVIGSHGGLHGGRPESALPVDACAALFHDAGRGPDGASVSRLPVLAERGIPAAVVDYESARIGDARSMWETGVVSLANALASEMGLGPGLAVRDWVVRLARKLV